MDLAVHMDAVLVPHGRGFDSRRCGLGAHGPGVDAHCFVANGRSFLDMDAENPVSANMLLRSLCVYLVVDTTAFFFALRFASIPHHRYGRRFVVIFHTDDHFLYVHTSRISNLMLR